MERRVYLAATGVFAISLALLGFILLNKPDSNNELRSVFPAVLPTTGPSIVPTQKPLPPTHILPQAAQMFQTFNNCGPATLGMILSRYNINISQQQLADDLRPNNNPQGIEDDKSVTFPELAAYARQQGLVAYHRPNGSIEKLKQLIAADIAVATRTWLNPGEDIGHYRVVRGYDDTTQEIIQDDSYHGPNLRYSYTSFNEMWRPFNYEYLIIAPKEKEDEIRSILGDEVDEKTAWSNALKNAESRNDTYSVFNQAIASYHLANPKETVRLYEQVASQLPARMLWYQIEPIDAYRQLGNTGRVFELSDQILNSGNRGYSELYVVRGKALLGEGRNEEARAQFETALRYHPESLEIQNLLNSV